MDELEVRVRNGEWLTVSEVATLFGVKSRSQIDRACRNGRLRWRPLFPGSSHRVVHPDDVITRLDDGKRVRGEIDDAS